MEALAILALLALAIGFWADSLKVREAVLRTCKRLCLQANLQLLEDTVVMSRLRLGRNQDGRLLLRRHYTFEFSSDGRDRRHGELWVLGARIEWVRFDHPDGVVIEAEPT